MKNILWIAFGLLIITAGCSSSRITSAWTANDIKSQQYNKIMVLGLVREADRSIQMNMEIHLVGDLHELGYQAVSCLQEYGPKAFENMDEATALDKLKTSGVEAVITIVLLDKQKERKYVPGNMSASPFGYYYNRFWGYRTALHNRIYQPGYYVTDTKYFWESNFYDMRTQKLLYSVQTQSFDPANAESMGHENGSMIVRDMVRKNVLKRMENMARY